jgi:hypothetical protein
VAAPQGIYQMNFTLLSSILENVAANFKHKIALDLEVPLLPVIKKCNCLNTLFNSILAEIIL